jgi:hypothetical protein
MQPYILVDSYCVRFQDFAVLMPYQLALCGDLMRCYMASAA